MVHRFTWILILMLPTVAMADGMSTLLPVYWGERYEAKASSLPPYIADVELEKHWEHTGAGEGIRVAVLDTGIDEFHPDIKGRIKVARNFSRSWRGKRGPPDKYQDRNAHGTHVATTIAAMAPNCRDFVIGKVLGDNGAGWNSDIAEAILWAGLDQKAHVINLSLGGPTDDPETKAAIEKVKQAGVLVFCATGNESASAVGFPARHCVGVGAIGRDRKLAWFSNRGKHVDLVGFGVNILAGVPGGGWQEMSGTSMATPWITAIAMNRLSAELKHRGEIYTNSDARMLELETFVTDLGPGGQDTSYGRGMPDLEKCFYERLDSSPSAPEPIEMPERIKLQFKGVEVEYAIAP